MAIERAKCIIAVARDVQDDEARQVLRDAADDAHVPESVAAAQIISELQADGAGVGTETTVEMLERGLTAVRPVQPAA
ncbi:hypothetical protein [Promicromonospora sp. NPDC057488]|uniref:hypothetical protein n=1 Tax=Promicromonospora sp. NPDC057488 TaxID=3346147 RepID=UPI00366AED21